MVVSPLRNVLDDQLEAPQTNADSTMQANTATQVCIFCALRFPATLSKRTVRWRSLHSSSSSRRPAQTATAVQESDQPSPSQESQWNTPRHENEPSSARPSTQQLEETRRNLSSLFQSTARPQKSPAAFSNATRRTPDDESGDYPGTSSRPPTYRIRYGAQSLGQPLQHSRVREPAPERDDWRSQEPQRVGLRGRQLRPPDEDDSKLSWSQLRRKPRREISVSGIEEGGNGANRNSRHAESKDRPAEASHEFVSFTAVRPSIFKPQHQPGAWESLATRSAESPQPARSGTRERPQSFGLIGRPRRVAPVRKDSEITAEPEPDAAVQEVGIPSPVHELSYTRQRPKSARGSSRRDRYEAFETDSQTSRYPESNRKKGRPRHTMREDDEEEDDRWADFEYDEEYTTARQEKKDRKKQRKQEKAQEKSKASRHQIVLPEFISIGNLASALKVRVEDFSNKLTVMGFEDVSNHHLIDGETAGLIAQEFNFNPIIPSKDSEDDIVALPSPTDTSQLMSRPPVVTIMGHVDHGKTTLLDWLRKSSVAATEHGGITQHIGAFTVPMSSGRTITFLDTPGHAAFLDMRARGANVTDIVILVVAADDSVKPQTVEAIKHAKAAKVPIIVAINKMDKEDANSERVKQDLARHGIEVEDFGGDTQTVCVSGKTGLGMEDMEESVIAQADILDVKADTSGQVEGWVLEATSKKSGKVATVLVRRGTLSVGDVLVAGQTWTRVKTLRNEAGALVDFAPPGTPVEVDGWREQPDAGAEVLQAVDEQRARRAVEVRITRAESEKLAADVIAMNETRHAEEMKREREKAIENGKLDPDLEPSTSASSAPGFTEVPFVLRADVSGSVEAIQASVLALGNSEVRPSILRSSFGPLSETDVDLAATAGGHLMSFNQPVDGNIKRMAEKAGVRVLDSSIIYRLTDEVKTLLEEKLPPLVISRVTGEAEVAEVFEISLKGKKKLPVAGCRVRNGVITKGSKVKVLRGKEVVYDGRSHHIPPDTLRQLVLIIFRTPYLSQAPQKRHDGNAQRYRVRSRLRRIRRLSIRRPGAML